MSDKQPHARITVEEVKAQYKFGLLTISGYLYNFLLASKREGWRLRSNVKKLCADLEISRPSFYRAISSLKNHRLIGFEIFGEVEIWVEERPCLEMLNKLSQIQDSSSQNRDSLYQIQDNSSQDRDSLYQILDKKSSKPSSEGSSSDSPDLIQISYRSNSTLSQLPAKPPAQEREFLAKDLEIIQDEKTQDAVYKPEKAEEVKEVKILDSDQIHDRSSAALKKDSKNELLAFVEKSAPDYVKSPRAWAKKCLETDGEYWQDKFQVDQSKRSLNAQIRHHSENAAAYQVHQAPISTIPIHTVADERARLHAKWMMGKLDPKYRQEAIAASTKLGFTVTETGIHLPGGTDPTQSLSSWLET
jgi:hypothetical protein